MIQPITATHFQLAVEKLRPTEAEEGGGEKIGSGTDQEIADARRESRLTGRESFAPDDWAKRWN